MENWQFPLVERNYEKMFENYMEKWKINNLR